MRWQGKTLTLCTLVPSMMLPLALTGCGSSGRSTTVVQSWDERPRFFTAAPGEDHSRFANMVWYDRPRVFTTRTESTPAYTTTYPASTYGTTSYGTTTYDNTHTPQYRTIPVESQNYINHDHHKDCDCPHKNRMKTEKTHYHPTTTNTYPNSNYLPGHTMRTANPGFPAGTVNTYGSDAHRNVTTPASTTTTTTTRESRVALTSDVGNRSFDGLIANWPADSRTAAMAMQAKYGPPMSTTTDQLIWRDQDPWAEIVVFKNGTPHSFPSPHVAVIAQSIYFNVDADKLDDLNDYRGNIKVDHARGLLTSKCRSEAGNFLALNLAHEILTGEKSASEANNLLAEKARAGINDDDDDMQNLQFDVGVDSIGNDVNIHHDMDVDSPETDRNE